MQFVSHAQNFEDVMLRRALKGVDKGFYIDIGAGWPDEHSVTKTFYDIGWRGINIEPNPYFYRRLLKDRAFDVNLQVAIGDLPGVHPFYCIKDTGLSTLDFEIANRHRSSGWEAEELNVSVRTLNDIWECEIPKSVSNVHFLKVDAEGFEKKIISSNDWSLNRPWIILVESTLPLSQEESYREWEGELLGSRYIFCYQDGLNRFYLAEEKIELVRFFQSPPNVFDGFKLAGCFFAEEQARKLNDEVELLNRKFAKMSSDLEKEEFKYSLLQAEAFELSRQNSTLIGKLHCAEKRVGEVGVLSEFRLKKIRELKSQLAANSNEIDRMVGSFSWAVTKPLRVLNPKYPALRFIKFCIWQAAKYKFLVFLGKKILPENSKLRVRVGDYLAARSQLSHLSLISKKDKSVDSLGSFSYLFFEQFVIAFSKDALKDRRGIGRVSNELYRRLELRAVKVSDSADFHASTSKGIVYFYSSIHWCPNPLPACSVVMVHDVIPLLFPEKFPEASVQWASVFKGVAQQAARILTISKSSASDICSHLEVPSENIKVIYNGISKLPLPEGSGVSHIEGAYFVFFGSHDHHKNVDVLFRAFSDSRLSSSRLVMIGDNAKSREDAIRLGIDDRVSFVGRIPDNEVAEVISGATALLFPSLYEGFGLPPFEAALLGVPSICSRRPAMTELLVDAALFVDPHNEEEWVEAIITLSKEAEVRDALAEKALDIATSYTWERAVDNLLCNVSSVASEE
ncbi:FkbM family methyltransferase [Microbulbifer sp. DLAB2-AA]|uniref:FkbM family methyltransferase n=1 Tax=Microbulbifer sp. DLAB2-AA TaxID=3243394 RepID=UPI00403A4083